MTQQIKRSFALLLMVLGLSFSFSQAANAHCQIPCGIFDDHARVEHMLEDVVTIYKSLDLIAELADKKDAQSQNQLIRWVMNKEKHADNIITTISEYFLAQRVKSSQKDYQERLVKHHAVMVAAMKATQNVDESYADTLRKAINELFEYYPEHKHK